MNTFRKLIPFIGLISITLILSLLTSGKLISFRNLLLIFNQAIFLMLASLGVSFVMAQGSIDLSQGSLLGFTGAMAATFALIHPNLAFPVALAVGLGIGLLNGLMVAKFKIPSFIVTISMLFILRGLTVFTTRAGSIAIPFEMYDLDNMSLKLTLLIIAILVTFYLFFFTRFGKYCRAIGSSEVVAKLSGVPVDSLKIFAFIIAGLLCGTCGYLNILRTGAADSKTGLLFEIDVLTALVIGGMPLTGGSGAKIQSALIGSLIFSILTNGLVLLGVQAEIQQAIKGIIFLVAVTFSFERKNAVYIK